MNYIRLSNEEIHELTNNDPNIPPRPNQWRCMIKKIGIIICIVWAIIAVHICLFVVLASVLEMSEKTTGIIGGIFMISCVILLCLGIRSFWKQSNDRWVTIPNDVMVKRLEEHNETVRQAELGDADAQCQLGINYQFGFFPVSQNHTEAVKWLRTAAEQGHPVAQYNLGACYASGDGIPKDIVEAIRWYQKAAEQGDARALHTLGVCYSNGEGVAKDEKEAVKWYRKSAEQGFAMAQNNLGLCYWNGRGVSQDVAESVKWLRLAAVQGHATAQLNLGVFYDNDDGVFEAIMWYSHAAKQGIAEANERVTDLINEVHLVAEQGDAESQFYLGMGYDRGGIFLENKTESVKWYRLAAEQGLARAQHNLGSCYATGDGVSKDWKEAVKWYRLAAEQGDSMAQYNVGACFAEGDGVSQDMEEAVKWFQKAAEQGNELAQYNLAVCYLRGEGVDRNEPEAMRWLRRAAMKGHEKSTDLLREIEGNNR